MMKNSVENQLGLTDLIIWAFRKHMDEVVNIPQEEYCLSNFW